MSTVAAFVILAVWFSSSSCSDIVGIFSVSDESNDFVPLNHLVLDKRTGNLYVGAVNSLTQVTEDFEEAQYVDTGPAYELCLTEPCPATEPTDNFNKALVIDYQNNQLIACGSARQGACSVHSLQNISLVLQNMSEPVVVNASTVAFIGPGPNATNVLYVGSSFTGNSSSQVPKITSGSLDPIPNVASRSLDPNRLFQIAELNDTAGTRMFVNDKFRDSFSINYVYGFASGGFSFFLTTQPISNISYNNTKSNISYNTESNISYDDTKSNMSNDSPNYISKLVRIYQDDPTYQSYTVLPISCNSKSGKQYNLVQAGYVGKPGSDLAKNLDITTQDDVLFAVFAESETLHDQGSNRSNRSSALCIYPLASIQRKFAENIQSCFSKVGETRLDYNSHNRTCREIKLNRNRTEEHFGQDINTPLERKQPIEAVSVMEFNLLTTAILATTTGNHTVAFIGTDEGYLKKVVVESATEAKGYADVHNILGSKVSPDLYLDANGMHLYVMTDIFLNKVKTQSCHGYKTCLDCLKDPYCGWCSGQKKCSLESECQGAPDPQSWISYNSKPCSIYVSSVTPKEVLHSDRQKLDIVIENYLYDYFKLFFCVFNISGRIIKTIGERTINGLTCLTPPADELPPIPEGHNDITADLSVHVASTYYKLATTSVTFIDCNTYTSCTRCISNSLCDWCIIQHRCSYHLAKEECNARTTGYDRGGYNVRKGPDFCPSIRTIDSELEEILVPANTKKGIVVQLHYGESISRHDCRIDIEGRITTVKAKVASDQVSCDPMEFNYAANQSNIIAPFGVLFLGNLLDNPYNVHLKIYKCHLLANNCEECLALDEKYECGWCQSSGSCEIFDQCSEHSSWIKRNLTCFSELN